VEPLSGLASVLAAASFSIRRYRVLMVVATAISTRNMRSHRDDRREKHVGVPGKALMRFSD
jgi:hypothetical protein